MSAGSETALRGQTQPAARAPGRLLGKVRVGRPGGPLALCAAFHTWESASEPGFRPCHPA